MIKFCSLFSGSSGNSLFVSYKDTQLLIDAGVSGIRIQNALSSIGEDPTKISAVLVTHEHSDHSKCVGVMSRRFDFPIYANQTTWNKMNGWIGNVKEHNQMIFVTGESFLVGDIMIQPFTIPHDASDPVGFRLTMGDKVITVATDIGHMNPTLHQMIQNSDLLLLECNHDLTMLDNGPYPYPLKQRVRSQYGHLCNDDAAKTIVQLACGGVKRFLIGHLSHENNLPHLALETVTKCLSEQGYCVGKDVEVDVVLRDQTSRVFYL